MEEGTQSAWLYELLQSEVDELVVTMPEKQHGSKDDARDALKLAQDLRAGAIKRRVYKSCGPYSELRAAVRSYTTLRDDLIRAKNRLKAIYRSRGVLPSGEEVFHPEKHGRWEKKLNSPQRESAELLYSQVEALTELRDLAERRLLEAAKPHKSVKIVGTAPAVGPIRAAQIVAAVVTESPTRAEGGVQGRRATGDQQDDQPPVARRLPAAARGRNEAALGQADDRPAYRGRGPADVEARGSLRLGETTFPHHRPSIVTRPG